MNYKLLLLMIVSIFILSACGSTEEPAATLVPTSIPTATVEPTATVAPADVPIVAAATATEVVDDDSEVPEPKAAAPEAIEVLMNDLYFGESNDNLANPPVWTVRSGADVTVAMDNRSGALQHNWAIVKAGEEVPSPFLGEEQMDVVLLDAGILEPNQTDTFAFTAPELGEYMVICTVAGHYPVMQGKLIVTE